MPRLPPGAVFKIEVPDVSPIFLPERAAGGIRKT
jgi:hypothetical protein